ncbi:hemolysin XhlA family protein [Clostridium chauvoei]|uniref:Hemolysin XhlA family protein n=2 Tax=Clostridium chauvoei TaxID=46867 RepID=A0ABD4RHX1_9CLOT|nr:hemolysin XhlA family protein [Clostridium chauvoei]ATD55402.1 hemolysin XhlA [Clostridium chauvoei]ATD56927.1 hemolysin XhlA [Clostridium chauvoei]MBX7280770.1 hemolysin XhlA family protein [Clostridium chauvoei]MBX7283253.1 hemolysin XhlA family protein [Clostridium chauvoei]MBX7285862.1 hemolysin XhlA family protein [Clostridium chauvoei]
MADENPIIYEIRENVVEIKATLTSIVQNVDLKFQVQEEKIKVANNRIKDLEDTNKWLWRAIAGTLISTVVAFLIKLK